MKMSVHIERLVLQGLPVTTLEGSLLQRAVETELARLLKTRGLSRELEGGGALPRVGAESVQLAKENPPAKLGEGIAKAVHEGIGNRGRGVGQR